MIFDAPLLLRWGKALSDLVKAAVISYVGKMPQRGKKPLHKTIKHFY